MAGFTAAADTLLRKTWSAMERFGPRSYSTCQVAQNALIQYIPHRSIDLRVLVQHLLPTCRYFGTLCLSSFVAWWVRSPVFYLVHLNLYTVSLDSSWYICDADTVDACYASYLVDRSLQDREGGGGSI